MQNNFEISINIRNLSLFIPVSELFGTIMAQFIVIIDKRTKNLI